MPLCNPRAPTLINSSRERDGHREWATANLGERSLRRNSRARAKLGDLPCILSLAERQSVVITSSCYHGGTYSMFAPMQCKPRLRGDAQLERSVIGRQSYSCEAQHLCTAVRIANHCCEWSKARRPVKAVSKISLRGVELVHRFHEITLSVRVDALVAWAVWFAHIASACYSLYSLRLETLRHG